MSIQPNNTSPTKNFEESNHILSKHPVFPSPETNSNIDEAIIALNQASLIVAHDDPHEFDAVVPPIVQTSLFTFSSYSHAEKVFRGEEKHFSYTRGNNPTIRQFEEMVAKLEEAEDALGFASGMAAISAVALTLLEPGDKLVCVKNCYPDAYRLFEVILKRFKINVVYVDGLDLPAIDEALYGAKLFYTESPTSWTMEALEVGALAKLAHKHGALVAIDNSWASPIFQKPIKLGVDIVIHTASKYLGGHSDVIAGVIASSKTMIDKIRDSRLYVGGKLSPFDAWLLIRGLRTLPIRVKAVGESALELARRLSKNPMVEKVCHPGLEKLPDGLIGTTGLFSFVFKEDVNIQIFIDALKIFKIGVSWGGHESLILPASIVLQQAAQPNSATDFGISPRSVRIYIGLEGTENLWQDLSEAINSASEYRK